MPQPTPPTTVPATRRRLPGWVLLVIVAAVIGGGLTLWDQVLKDRLVPKRWGVVEPGLIYRSGQLSQHLVKQTLADHDIKVIVDLTAVVPSDPDQSAEAAAATALGIERRKFPLGGSGEGAIENYADAVALMVHSAQQKKPVLVHCAAGTQRTGGAVGFYRLLVQRRPPAEVLAEMQQFGGAHDGDSPLIRYMNQHMADMARLLVQRGVIDAPPEPLPQLAP